MSESEFRQIFAKNLAKLLMDNRETQVDIVRLLNVSKSTVSSWVSGEKMPRMDKIEAMARHFGVPKSQLIEEYVEPEDSEGNLKVALFGGDTEVTDEMWNEVKNFASFVVEREKNKK